MNLSDLRPTWVEINLDAVAHNIKEVRDKVGEDTEIMAVVKADAYGHGIEEVTKRALEAGATQLGIATVEEGIRLREAGFEVPILILGTLLPNQIKEVIEYNITPNVYTYETAQKVSKQAEKMDEAVKIHVKLDTGMGRIGLRPGEAVEEIKKISTLPNLEIEGVFTHFPVADSDEEYTKEQIAKYKDIIDKLEKAGIEISIKHTANSAGIVQFPDSYFDVVRMGIILYGLYPAAPLRDMIDLEPVMSWKAKIAYLKEVGPGSCISYGCTYVTDSETKVATLPVGYHDGYFRSLSNEADVLLPTGERVPVIGRVCMDQTMIDVTGKDIEEEEIVTLLGRTGGEEITAMELADILGTINYEVACRVGPRAPRVYYKDGKAVKIKDEVLDVEEKL